MNYMKNRITQFLTLFVLALFLFSGYGVVLAQDVGTSKVIFYVKWYDVGKEALEGLNGVQRVEKGIRYFKEINTVYYDPAVITIKEMETALKKAGTYTGTVEWNTQPCCRRSCCPDS